MKRKTIDIENLSMELDCSEATNPSFKKPSAVPQKQAKHLPNDVLVARSGRKRFGKKSPQFFQCITAIVKQLIDDYEKGATSNVSKIKADYSTKYSLIDSPKTVEIISAIPEEYRDALVPILKTKPVRTASGIVAVAVMCKPHRCPHQGVVSLLLFLFYFLRAKCANNGNGTVTYASFLLFTTFILLTYL